MATPMALNGLKHSQIADFFDKRPRGAMVRKFSRFTEEYILQLQDILEEIEKAPTKLLVPQHDDTQEGSSGSPGVPTAPNLNTLRPSERSWILKEYRASNQLAFIVNCRSI
jgi:hypothetical protein